jgi:hypothetical protein
MIVERDAMLGWGSSGVTFNPASAASRKGGAGKKNGG